jgi:TRAP-type uncharacterized transport system substrate-binding protein
MTSFSSVVAIMLGLGAAGIFAFRYVQRQSVLRLSVAAGDASDLALAEAIQHQLRFGEPHMRIALAKTEGELASAAALDEGHADLAIVRADVGRPKHGGIVLVARKDAVLILAPPASKPLKIPELAKKRIGLVPGTEANSRLLDTLVDHYGVVPGAVQRVPLKRHELRDAVSKKLIDVLFVVSPLGDPATDEAVAAMATARGPPVIMGIPDAEAIASRMPAYEKLDVQSGFFKGTTTSPPEDLATLGVPHLLVARQDLSELTVAGLTKRLFAIRPALAAQTKAAEYMEAPDTEKGARYPVHAGSADWYGDNESSFMDRYGDWIYIAAMLAGGLGSILATLISAIHARSRNAAITVVDDLIETKRRALAAANSEALADVAASFERSSIVALQRAREGRFSETAMETVRLAVQEARGAITDRRVQLTADPPVHAPAFGPRPVRP